MMRHKNIFILPCVILAMILPQTAVFVYAGETETDLSVPDEVVSAVLPVIPESGKSPFDFIMDPQGLINETGAVRYGGSSFEEGETLYFENTEGAYDYSGQSDWLEVVSTSSVPLNVTIEARVYNISSIKLTPDSSFYGDEEPSIYLVLVDNQGCMAALDEDGAATIYTEMAATEDGSFSVCSFGLTGACNPYGDWSDVDENPYVVVTWTIEPVLDGVENYQGEPEDVPESGGLSEGEEAREDETAPEEDAAAVEEAQPQDQVDFPEEPEKQPEEADFSGESNLPEETEDSEESNPPEKTDDSEESNEPL